MMAPFLRPIAHRGLWDASAPENSLAAFRAAARAGYGIELDVQMAADGAVAFHDEHLLRMTGADGPVAARATADLARLRLKGTDGGIPTLAQALAAAGSAPVLVEVKDQTGVLGPTDGRLEEAVAAAVRAHDGSAAVMSFNPHCVLRLRDLLPGVPRGLTTDAFDPAEWPGVPEATLDRLRAIPDFLEAGASFVSHDRRDLHRPRVAELKRGGAAILCWTVRSAEQEAEARRVADAVTFEGYRP